MAGRFEVGLLGEVEVRSSGADVPIAGAKLKAIVALLALGSPHPVAAERLIDEVWDEDLPGNPANSLHAQISSLRRLLGRDAVERRGQGYLLAVGPDDVDAIRLRAARPGRSRGAAPTTPAAAAQPLLGAALEPRPRSRRSATSASSASHGRPQCASASSCRAPTRAWSTAGWRSGTTPAVVAELTALVQAHPLHERFHAQLIIALYRCGRQADALQAYQQARRVLLEELGVEPGPELRALEVAILNQDPALDPADHRRTGTGADRRHRRRPPVTAPSTRFCRWSAATRMWRPLRADLASARAGRGRVALVGGEPGVGKTRLVEEIANEAAERGATVVWGRCYDGRGAPAFWPWVQIVGDLLDRFDRTAVADALRTTAGDLAQVVPAVKEFVADLAAATALDPESARFRLGQAITTTLRRLARHRPARRGARRPALGRSRVPRRARRPGRHARRRRRSSPSERSATSTRRSVPRSPTPSSS